MRTFIDYYINSKSSNFETLFIQSNYGGWNYGGNSSGNGWGR